MVAFFRSDHYYANPENFAAGMELAFTAAEQNGDSVVLLGARACHPETDYSWIEEAPAISAWARTADF